MRRTLNYPSSYNPDKLLAQQSAVPSQQMPMGIPYYPAQPLGINEAPPAESGSVPSGGYTAYVWDSRPAMSQDFFFDFTLVQDNPIPAFTIPQGYVGILRSVSVNIYNENSTVTGAVMNVHGYPSNNPTFTASIAVSGTPQIGFTDIDLTEAAFGTVEIPCFVLAQQGQTFSLALDLVNLGPPNANWFVTFYGQLLLATGRDLTQECTNQYPLPVTDTDDTSGI